MSADLPFRAHSGAVRITEAEAGCYLGAHRGHYAIPAMVELAVEYGFIVGGFERFALDAYDEHSHEERYPSDELHELADEALAWLNSGRVECDDCGGTGVDPRSGEYFTRADDPDAVKRCKRCSGTGRGDRVAGQNYPPILPDGYAWEWSDGDFGLYAIEGDDECPRCGATRMEDQTGPASDWCECRS